MHHLFLTTEKQALVSITSNLKDFFMQSWSLQFIPKKEDSNHFQRKKNKTKTIASIANTDHTIM